MNAPPRPIELQLAKEAYRAYGQATGGKNYRGEPMPEWDDLGIVIQNAWIQAARAVADTVSRRP